MMPVETMAASWRQRDGSSEQVTEVLPGGGGAGGGYSSGRHYSFISGKGSNVALGLSSECK